MKVTASVAIVAVLACVAFAAVPSKRPPTLKEEVDDLKARVVALEKAVADLKAAQVAKAPADNRFKVGMTIDEADALFTKLGAFIRRQPVKETVMARGKAVTFESWFIELKDGRRIDVNFEDGIVVRVVE